MILRHKVLKGIQTYYTTTGFDGISFWIDKDNWIAVWETLYYGDARYRNPFSIIMNLSEKNLKERITGVMKIETIVVDGKRKKIVRVSVDSIGDFTTTSRVAPRILIERIIKLWWGKRKGKMFRGVAQKELRRLLK